LLEDPSCNRVAGVGVMCGSTGTCRSNEQIWCARGMRPRTSMEKVAAVHGARNDGRGRWRHCGWVLVAALTLVAGCTKSDDAGRSGGSAGSAVERSGSSSTSTSTSQAAGSSRDSGEEPEAQPVGVREAEDLLTVLAPVVPIPEDARGCVAEKLAEDPELVAALRRSGAKGEVPGGVMDLGAACMQELHALPAFLDGVDEQVDGGLSEAERSCVTEGYLALDPEVLDAAVADAVGAGRGVKAAGEIKSMLLACGVKVGD